MRESISNRNWGHSKTWCLFRILLLHLYILGIDNVCFQLVNTCKSAVGILSMTDLGTKQNLLSKLFCVSNLSATTAVSTLAFFFH